MKCIEVRQKMNLAFDETNVKYDKKLTQKLLLRTVEGSIQGVFTIQEVTYLLKQGSVSDVEVLSAITKVASYESEIYICIYYYVIISIISRSLLLVKYVKQLQDIKIIQIAKTYRLDYVLRIEHQLLNFLST